MRLKNKIVLVTASTRGIGLACVKACAAINYLTKLIAVQEAFNHIRCNAILPGMTATEAVEKNLSDDFRNLFLRHIPFKKIGLPEEIASAVVYFASDESAWITGRVILADGGVF